MNSLQKNYKSPRALIPAILFGKKNRKVFLKKKKETMPANYNSTCKTSILNYIFIEVFFFFSSVAPFRENDRRQ